MPILDFNQDVYADWLLTNSNSLNNQKFWGRAQQTIGIGMGIAGAILIGSGVGAGFGVGLLGTGFGLTMNGGNLINQAVATQKDHSMFPDSIGGLSSASDINACSNTNGFWFYDYTIKSEFARVIDNYFDMYGYKVNSLEVPNLHTRINWNFLKIIDPNIEGANIPDIDMNKFKQQLQIGITFWHNASTFRDYSQSNGNVT